ncbi:MAG: ABC transporter ATP-binding protein [Planctomycetaceae bacterium]
MTSPTTKPTLVVRDLKRQFTGPTGTLTVLNGVNLELSTGEALAITGPSGSGKSTLLYIVGLLDTPTAGEVRILGENPFQLNNPQQAAFRNQKIGFIFQDHHLLPQCNVLENVLIPTLAGHRTGFSPQEVAARASQLLERVGLKDRVTHRPSELSGGERQRVAVCRALINRPLILLADEPTGNLDRVAADVIGSLLLEVAQEEGTVLITVTHSLELAKRFPRHLELQDGQLVPASS